MDVEIEILRKVDDVERQPAEDKHHEDGHQDTTPPPVPGPLHPPPDRVPPPGHPLPPGAAPDGQLGDDHDVGQAAHHDGQGELAGEDEHSVNLPVYICKWRTQ